MQRSEYLSLRRKFEPTILKLIIVAESPPKSGLFFYRTDGKPTEPLFRALMKQIGFQPETKLEGLCKFRERGWLLVDATYKQVNERGDRHRRDCVIKEDYLELIRDLDNLLYNHRSKVPLVLIKANVCRLLEPSWRTMGSTCSMRSRSSTSRPWDGSPSSKNSSARSSEGEHDPHLHHRRRLRGDCRHASIRSAPLASSVRLTPRASARYGVSRTSSTGSGRCAGRARTTAT